MSNMTNKLRLIAKINNIGHFIWWLAEINAISEWLTLPVFSAQTSDRQLGACMESFLFNQLSLHEYGYTSYHVLPQCDQELIAPNQGCYPIPSNVILQTLHKELHEVSQDHHYLHVENNHGISRLFSY